MDFVSQYNSGSAATTGFAWLAAPGGASTLTGIGSLRRDGTFFGLAFQASSDKRLKRDIRPYARGLDTIMALRPVRFVWRHDGSKSMGFIAQDVQKVLPDLVARTNPKKSDSYLSVNYAAIVAPLTAAVQEQQREIVELRAEIKALKQSRK